MSFEYDVDELDDDVELAYTETETEDELDSEFDDDEALEFEDIDFDALGIDPIAPTAAKPGSEEKVLMLAARYAAGVPLWNDRDCYDHGPGEAAARLLRMQQAAKN